MTHTGLIRKRGDNLLTIRKLLASILAVYATIIPIKMQSYIIFLIFPNRELFLIGIIQNVPVSWHFFDKMNVFLAFNCYFCLLIQRVDFGLNRYWTCLEHSFNNPPYEEHHAPHRTHIRPYLAIGHPYANHSLVGRQRQLQHTGTLQWQAGEPRHDCHQEEG